MRQPMCIDVTNSHEYNRALTPWCDHAFLTTWRSTFLKSVRQLGAAFPNAKIYVRTQPFLSTLILGNQACQGAMNNIIQEIGESLLPLEQVSKGCRTLNMNALFAQVAHRHELCQVDKSSERWFALLQCCKRLDKLYAQYNYC
mmetsp:Transcript_50326/g.87830  ORF Transcript_50326/g.87830 Transcript_50326/m.87830 type:complete len:143 (-) Transcript_50326:118-546(-)